MQSSAHSLGATGGAVASDRPVSRPSSTLSGRSEALALLLQRMHSLLPHTHQGAACARETDTHDSDSSGEHACSICSLLPLLCHWVAARVALPDDIDEDFVVLWMTRRRAEGGVAGALYAEACRNEENKEEGSEMRGDPTLTSSFSTAGCTAACLLPSDTLHATSWLRDSTASSVPGSASSGKAKQRCDVSLQREIDVCFNRAKNGSRSMKDDTLANCTEGEGLRRGMESVFYTYHAIRDDESYFFHPTLLPKENAALLLQIYAECRTELAALALLHLLSPSSPLSPEVMVRTVSDAFHSLLNAQQAARSAASYLHSSPCSELLRARIRPLLAALSLSSSSASSTATFLHPRVDVSCDPLLSVSGCGLVAAHAIAEGELLLREASLLAVPASPSAESNMTTTNTSVKSRGCVWDRMLCEGKKMETVEEDASETALTTAGALKTASVSTGNHLRKGDALTSAAAHLVDVFAQHSESTVTRTWWWYRWALALPRRRAAPPPAAEERAQQPLLSSTVSLPQTSMRDWVMKAARAALGQREGQGAVKEATSSVPGDTAPLLPQLCLLPVRDVDELHLPRPAVASVALHCLEDRLMPHSTPEASAAVFALLSFANHACAPNAIVVFDADARNPGGVIGSLIALRDIEANEPLTISYVPATTALTIAQAKLTDVLGFVCRCRLCTDKAALLHGVVCGECGQLVYAPPAAVSGHRGRLVGANGTDGDGVRGESMSSAFTHSAHCTRRHRDDPSDGAEDAAGGVAKVPTGSVVAQLQRQLDRVSAHIAATENPPDDDGRNSSACDGCVGHDHTHPRTSAIQQDPLVAAVRQLLDLDAYVAQTLLPTHHLRLRARLESFAYASAAQGLGSTNSARLIHLCANTVEELEVVLGANHPLLTGLRMHLVFSRGRHVRAVHTAETLASGARHADCCGAVREQAALMELPFVMDPLVRRCVTRCFQEHYVQLLGWRLPLLTNVSEEDVLRTFMCRYPVELEAAGITTAAHMEFLASMEDGDTEAV